MTKHVNIFTNFKFDRKKLFTFHLMIIGGWNTLITPCQVNTEERERVNK